MSEVILVTGARGFVGSRLVAALQRDGVEVFTHDRTCGDIAGAPLRYTGVTHVYHLAAKTKVPESWSYTPEYYRTNVLGTVNVLELCRNSGATLTLLSSYVYGTPESLPISESHPLHAFNPYSHTKIVAEDICRYYAEQFGIPITIVRPFNIYGPGQDSHFLIAKLIAQATDPNLDQFTVLDSRPRRDYLYLDDLIDLLLRSHKPNVTATYNAGSGRSFSIEHIVSILNSFLATPKRLVSQEQERPSEVMDVVADISAAARLNWRPAVTLEDGLRRTFDWAVTHKPHAHET
jgi:nucleoside-diphosphate-sugar epimerase